MLPTNDPVERSITYMPAAGEKLDPRVAITGVCAPQLGLVISSNKLLCKQ